MKKLILMFGMIFLIGIITANLGTFKQNECMQIVTTLNASKVNLSGITTPSPIPEIMYTNRIMTQNGAFYNFTFCNTSKLGIYIYGYCDDAGNCYNNDFEITGTGYAFDQPKAILYLGLLGLLVILFIVDVAAIPMLPSKDNYDEEGILVSINQLKYIRPILWVIAYLLLMVLIFIGSNVALAYMGETLIGQILFKISQIMLALMLPMLILWFIYIFYNIFQDNEMKKYIERGWE